MSDRRIVFYGDLNCPFCYAENERIVALGLGATVQWRGIEHMPELTAPWGDGPADDQRALDEEVARLRERAPEVDVVRPLARPSSSPGTLAIAEAQTTDEAKARDLRTWLYRALWRDGRDISTEAIVAEGCRAVGLPDPTSPRTARRQLKVWTAEWSNGPFDRRLPVLATLEDERLLGLAAPEAIAAFVEGRSAGAHGTDVCRA